MIVASAACIWAAGSSCRRQTNDAAWHSNERVRIELDQHLRLLTYRFESRGGPDIDKLGEHAAGHRDRTDTIAALERNLTTLRAELESLRSEVDEMSVKVARQSRRLAASSSFDTFVTADGKTYKDVVVTRVTEGGVTVRHSSGSARFQPADLSLEQQEYFGITPEAAKREAREESLRALAYERQLTAARATAEEERDVRTVASASRRITESRSSAVETIARHRDRNRTLAQPARRFGTNPTYRVRGSSRPRFYSVYPCVPSYQQRLRVLPTRNTRRDDYPGNTHP